MAMHKRSIKSDILPTICKYTEKVHQSDGTLNADPKVFWRSGVDSNLQL